ncbi:hypothetical protein [Spirosoma radiotolerans]|uniref:hypothetical protein n=1 Tax=Spirosoma radiotolerans TaxID=1379870 RepID=UPI000A8A3105|nr:hypothetical protein [Spirosoma radiotolerans]
MPAMGASDDEWIASVLSYIRYEFVPSPRPSVRSDEVKAIRKQTAGHEKAWTLDELQTRPSDR